MYPVFWMPLMGILTLFNVIYMNSQFLKHFRTTRTSNTEVSRRFGKRKISVHARHDLRSLLGVECPPRVVLVQNLRKKLNKTRVCPSGLRSQTQVLVALSCVGSNPIARILCIGRSIMVSIPACHAGDPGSIPGDRDTNFLMRQHDRVVKVVAC